jgi:hypothetical protein
VYTAPLLLAQTLGGPVIEALPTFKVWMFIWLVSVQVPGEPPVKKVT